jgi:multidrug transporter EmrE-like cation transporter
MNIILTIHKWMDESIVDELLVVVFLIAIVESVAQNKIKQSDEQSINMILGLGAYMIVGYLLHYAYHKFPLSKINVMWSALSIILASGLGYMLYDEPMTAKSVMAVVLAIGAIYLTYDS